ncbi:MAG: CPBP family intramembrane metalloprotease [Spirochaetes bacterium]|nr:CPBP family intramembrane metalloprotease [Spirochaetota bacterium]
MKKNGAFLFVGLTFFLSWSLAGVAYLAGVRYYSAQSLAVMIGYMFVPMIVAVLLQKAVFKQPLVKPLGITFRLNPWWLFAWLFPPAASFATLGVSILFPGVEYSPEMTGLLARFRSLIPPEQFSEIERQIAATRIHPVWIVLAQGLVAGPTVNAVAGFGEELGWRGYLQQELEPLGFYRSSFLIGFIWGVWHMPIILQGHNYPAHPVAGVFMMIAFCMLLSPIFSFVRISTRSVIAAAVIHGSLNATVGLSVMLIDGGNDLLTGVTGLAGFIVLASANLLLYLYRRTTEGSEDRAA